jgi:cytosine/adenosine deaminase-related metal-dependent hydrolase
MQPDLILKNANIANGPTGVDIACQNGKIIEIAEHIDVPSVEVLDCGGMLVSPPFVDSHFHMDATLSLGLPRMNESGTLLEGIALWGELKPLLTAEAVIERALKYCDLAVSKGLLAIRTHVDVCDDRLLAVDALLEVKKQVAPYIDLQLVAFPQDVICEVKPPRKTPSVHWTRVLMLWAVFRISNAPWPMVHKASKNFAKWRRTVGLWSICIATNLMIRCRVISKC